MFLLAVHLDNLCNENQFDQTGFHYHAKKVISTPPIIPPTPTLQFAPEYGQLRGSHRHIMRYRKLFILL
jgi:hypothetical protein